MTCRRRPELSVCAAVGLRSAPPLPQRLRCRAGRPKFRKPEHPPVHALAVSSQQRKRARRLSLRCPEHELVNARIAACPAQGPACSDAFSRERYRRGRGCVGLLPGLGRDVLCSRLFAATHRPAHSLLFWFRFRCARHPHRLGEKGGLLPRRQIYGPRVVRSCDNRLKRLAPRAGFEPATIRLTVECSTTELPGNTAVVDSGRPITKAYRRCKASRLRDGRLGRSCGGNFRHRVACRPKRRRREGWRPRPELNRGTRICSPLRHHSATWPRHRYIGRVAARQHGATAAGCLPFAGPCRKSCALPHDQGPRMTDFAAARRMMVDGQVRTADVTDLRLLAAMLDLPRERFFPADKAALAYLDLDAAGERAGPAGPPPAQADGAGQADPGRRHRRRPTACSMSAAPPAIRPRCWRISPAPWSASRRTPALARQAADGAHGGRSAPTPGL